MNRQQTEQLLAKIRGRVAAFHDTTGTKREFRAEAGTAGAPSSIYLYDYIGGWDGVSAKDMVATLAELSGDVDLHINSGGGDIFEGVAIYTALGSYSRGTVRSYIDGIAASAASFVALAGSEVIVEAPATMMIHDGWGFTIGNEQDHLDAAGVLGKLSGTIAEMYAKKAGGTAEEWRTKMRAETWYTAAEAVADGLADRIAGQDAAAPANAFDLSVFNYAGRALAAAPVIYNEAQPFDVDALRDALKGAFQS